MSDRRLARLGRPGGRLPLLDASLIGHVPVGIVVAKPGRERHGGLVPAGVVLIYRGNLEDREGRIIDSSLVTLHLPGPIPRRLVRLAARQLVGAVVEARRRALQDVVSRRMRARLAWVNRRYRRSIEAAARRERWLARTVTESIARTLVQPGLFDRRAVARAELDRQTQQRWLEDSRTQLRSLEAGEVLRVGPVELALAIVMAGTVGPS